MWHPRKLLILESEAETFIPQGYFNIVVFFYYIFFVKQKLL